MRARPMMLSALLLLAPAPAVAQVLQPGAPQVTVPAQGLAGAPFTGSLDVGGQLTGTDGDAARYERYRDFRDGPATSLNVSRMTDRFLFSAGANHIGFRDQRYTVGYARPKIDVGFQFAGTPLNFSYLTRTPYQRNGSVLTLDDAAQRAVQGPTVANNDGTAVGVPCAPGALPAACANPAQASQAKANRSIYNDLANQFDLRYLRNTTGLTGVFSPTRDVEVDAALLSTWRKGEQPWSGSFAFNNAIELPKPINERTNDLNVGVSYSRDRGSIRVGLLSSWFTNQYHDLVWDNPLFVTDFDNGRLPPNGPYDPSGYSNGNGPALGRQAMAPDNSSHTISTSGVYKLWRRTSINGAAQLTTQNQNDALIPWTTNPLINTPAVLAAFPRLAALPRPTAEASATGVNTLLNFTTRATNAIGFNVRYRFNRRDVRTPLFNATEYVRLDAVPGEIEEGFSPQFDNSRHVFDATVSYMPRRLGTVRVGYGHEQIRRDGRGFADVGEHILRVSWDTYSSELFTVRASVDAGRRRGTGYIQAAAGSDDTLIPETGPAGTQPTLRYYDEADRDRTRGSLVFTVLPIETVDLFVQFSGGRDSYLREQNTPVSVGRANELFGLLRSTNTSWNAGININPTERIALGASYGRDTYSSFQRSRNANPPPDPSWGDPSRDWTLDNDDRINNVNVYLDLLDLIFNTSVRFNYDMDDSDNSFVHGGPRVVGLAAIGQFVPLPSVTSTWHRFSADVQHFFTRKVGIGVGYYFEKLRMRDFSVIDTEGPVGFAPQTGEPRIDWLGAMITGYGPRPYTGGSAFVRLLYRF